MDVEEQISRPSPLRASPDKRRHTVGGWLPRLHRRSIRTFLSSFFSCSGSNVGDDADHMAAQHGNIGKQPVISPTRPGDVKRRAGHASKSSWAQQGSVMGLSTTLDNPAKYNDKENCQSITPNDLLVDTDKQAKERWETVLPSISDTSAILSESLRRFLYAHLPILVRGREWVLLYSTWKHGISLRMLYRQSSHLSGPCLLVVEDTKSAMFGGLLMGPLCPTAKPKYQGTNETFVFTSVTRELELFHPTGLNCYYSLCTNEMLAFGGGGAFALRLDGDLLHGSSGLSETFGNCCLAEKEEFTIKHVELWGFAHTSKYVPKEASYHRPDSFSGISRW